MDSIILAGGFAKRMLPLTEKTPKQLLDVAGEPMLTHVLRTLEKVSPERVILSVNSFFSSSFSQFIDNYQGSLNLELFVESSESEDEKLGEFPGVPLFIPTKDSPISFHNILVSPSKLSSS